MSGVYLCSHTNSTLFTTCCNTAITNDESCCPRCGEEVPLNPQQRWDSAMEKLYGRERLRKMRDGYARKELAR